MTLPLFAPRPFSAIRSESAVVQESRMLWERVAEARPLDQVARFRLAEARSFDRMFAAEARTLLNDLVRSNPAWLYLPDWHIAMARAVAWNDDAAFRASINEAVGIYREAGAETNLCQVYGEAGSILFDAGRHGEAIEWYRMAIGLAPQAAATRAALGKAYVLSGQLELARHQLAELRQLASRAPKEEARAHGLEWLDALTRDQAAEYAERLESQINSAVNKSP